MHLQSGNCSSVVSAKTPASTSAGSWPQEQPQRDLRAVVSTKDEPPPHPPGDLWQYLEAFLDVSAGEGMPVACSGCKLGCCRDPTIQRTVPTAKNDLAPMSVVPRLRNLL